MTKLIVSKIFQNKPIPIIRAPIKIGGSGLDVQPHWETRAPIKIFPTKPLPIIRTPIKIMPVLRQPPIKIVPVLRQPPIKSTKAIKSIYRGPPIKTISASLDVQPRQYIKPSIKLRLPVKIIKRPMTLSKPKLTPKIISTPLTIKTRVSSQSPIRQPIRQPITVPASADKKTGLTTTDILKIGVPAILSIIALTM